VCCLLRNSICNFITVDSGVSFHPFEFCCPVLFVQVYCSLPDSFYEVVVIFSAPYCVQCYSAVHVDDCCPVFVLLYLLRFYDLKCFYDSQLFSLVVSTPVVQLEFKLFREYLPCENGNP